MTTPDLSKMSDAEVIKHNGHQIVARKRNPVAYAARYSGDLPLFTPKYIHWLINWFPKPGETKAKGMQLHRGPPKAERIAWLEHQTGAKWDHRALMAFQRRPDFKEKLRQFRNDVAALTLELHKGDGPWWVTKNKEAAEATFKNEDYRTFEAYAKSALGHLLPKQPDVIVAQQQNIVISSKQAESIDAEIIEVEAKTLDP